jgi:ribosomal protein S18 acetylase RimI-like enzyme
VLLQHRTPGHLPTAILISLRPVRPDDEALLLAVYTSTRQEELALTDWDDGQKAAFCRQQFSAQRTWYEEQYVGASFQVIEADGEPAGRLYVHRRPEEIRIVDISLLPEFRARGIGSALIRALQREASASTRMLSIHVERFNRALSLYRRLGFEAAGEHGVYLLLRWPPVADEPTAVIAG